MTHRKKKDFTVLGERDFKLVQGVFQVRDPWTIEFPFFRSNTLRSRTTRFGSDFRSPWNSDFIAELVKQLLA